MPSNLYSAAVKLLGAGKRAALELAEDWLGSSGAADPSAVDGPKILDNVKREAHLIGDRDFGAPRRFSEFLELWCDSHAKATANEDRKRAFHLSCAKFALQGTPIPHSALPDRLLRYVVSSRLVANVVERTLGKAARDALNRGLLSVEDALSRVASQWDKDRMTSLETLAKNSPVFATYDLGCSLNRDDANEVAEALALPSARRPRRDVLIELEYPTATVSDRRIPTVADAGWYDGFAPAEEAQPDEDRPNTCVGWTQPLGAQAPQPELVHENKSLRVLTQTPRLVGRLS